MTRYILGFILIFILFVQLDAQEDVEEMMKKLQKATQEKINQSEQAVQDFIDKNDADFAKFLEQDWQMFQAFQGQQYFNKPKPKTAPVAEKTEDIRYTGEMVKEISRKTIPRPENIEPVRQASFRQSVQKEKVAVDFFSKDLEFEIDGKMKDINFSQINNESISKYWEKCCLSDYQPLVDQVKTYQNAMGVNDWGLLSLIHDLGTEIYSQLDNRSYLFTWFIMTKLGYDVKVGYNNSEVKLLIPTENMLYSTSYLMLNNRKYFMISLDKNNEISLGDIYTYQGSYTGADKEISMNILKSPIITNQKLKREYKFKYKDTHYTIPVIFYKDAIEYFEYYPQTNFEVYFSAAVTPSAEYSFIIAFKPLIKGKTEPEAVNMILRFVQTAFKYKTDGENFGREKPLFPEETLYYEYSDCEDRSILFAHLVRELLGLEVIGLSYPCHIATAVKFNSPVNGSTVYYNHQNYLICDPTYINADIGQCMSQFVGVKPGIIKF